MRETHGRVVAAIVDAVADLHGTQAARALADAGLGMLHTLADPSDVAAIRDRVLDALREELLELGVRIGRRVLHWNDDFFLDDYLIVRINFPYEAARHGARDAENPGIGRLSPQVRALAAARRARDPVYQPAAYHRDHSPAAWAHGPHIDSWSGHARDVSTCGGRSATSPPMRGWSCIPKPPRARCSAIPPASTCAPARRYRSRPPYRWRLVRC